MYPQIERYNGERGTLSLSYKYRGYPLWSETDRLVIQFGDGSVRSIDASYLKPTEQQLVRGAVVEFRVRGNSMALILVPPGLENARAPQAFAPALEAQPLQMPSPSAPPLGEWPMRMLPVVPASERLREKEMEQLLRWMNSMTREDATRLLVEVNSSAQEMVHATSYNRSLYNAHIYIIGAEMGWSARTAEIAYVQLWNLAMSPSARGFA